MKKIIETIITHLVNNAEELSKDKISGVFVVGNCYRIHKSDFLPRFMTYSDKAHQLIAVCVEEVFKNKCKYDPIHDGGWLTIMK